MKQMTIKSLLFTVVLLFSGWAAFAQGTTDEVYLLADNKIQFDISGNVSATDSAIWRIETAPSTWTELTTATTGVYFADTQHLTLQINGAEFTQFSQANLTDSFATATWKISVQVVNAGGCYADDQSYYLVHVLPNLGQMVVTASGVSALCENNQVQATLTATKPALTGSAASSVSIDDITWWTRLASATSFTQISSGSGGATITADNSTTPGTSTLSFTTPGDTVEHLYQAQAGYVLPTGYNLIVSSGSTDDGHSTSNNISVQAAEAPAAPVINGTINGTVGGW